MPETLRWTLASGSCLTWILNIFMTPVLFYNSKIRYLNLSLISSSLINVDLLADSKMVSYVGVHFPAKAIPHPTLNPLFSNPRRICSSLRIKTEVHINLFLMFLRSILHSKTSAYRAIIWVIIWVLYHLVIVHRWSERAKSMRKKSHEVSHEGTRRALMRDLEVDKNLGKGPPFAFEIMTSQGMVR